MMGKVDDKVDDVVMALWKEAAEVAVRFAQDAGYEFCRATTIGTRPGVVAGHPSFGIYELGRGSREELDGLAFYVHIQARKGPNATRKTPVEYLVVRVRLSGPAHKTLRVSFVTTPPDALRDRLSS